MGPVQGVAGTGQVPEVVESGRDRMVWGHPSVEGRWVVGLDRRMGEEALDHRVPLEGGSQVLAESTMMEAAGLAVLESPAEDSISKGLAKALLISARCPTTECQSFGLGEAATLEVGTAEVVNSMADLFLAL